MTATGNIKYQWMSDERGRMQHIKFECIDDGTTFKAVGRFVDHELVTLSKFDQDYYSKEYGSRTPSAVPAVPPLKVEPPVLLRPRPTVIIYTVKDQQGKHQRIKFTDGIATHKIVDHDDIKLVVDDKLYFTNLLHQRSAQQHTN